MARNDPTIYMRVPQELKDMLDDASTHNRRSLTAEVVARLQNSFKAEQEVEQRTAGSGAAPEDVEQALAQIEQGARILKDVIRGRAELIAPKSITSGTGRAISGGSEVEAEESPQKAPLKK